MISQFLFAGMFVFLFICLIIISEYAYRHYHINPEITRKASHVASGIFSLSFVMIFDSHFYVLIPGFIFLVVLYIARKRKLFPSIDQVNRETSGSYLFPIAIYLVFLIGEIGGNSLFFVLPVLTITLSDPIAAYSGSSIQRNNRTIALPGFTTSKTVIGSAAFLVSSFIISMITLYIYNVNLTEMIKISVTVSIVATVVEMFSIKGSDNLTVPIAVALTLSAIL
jgi:dolichol kinase